MAPDTINPESAPSTRCSRIRLLAAGAQIGLIGGVAVGMAECAGAVALASKHFDAGRWPVSFILAALGKAMVTHVLVWTPLVVLATAAILLLARGRAQCTLLPPLTAAFVLLCGAVTLPTDLLAAGRLSAATLAAGLIGVVAASGVVYWALRRVARRNPRRVLRLTNVATGIALVPALVFGLVFANSPLRAPAAYTVATKTATTAPRPAHPHVLWVVLDTVRADHTSAHGYVRPTTPFLDGWAAKAVVFDRAVANGIWTLPSHAAMFSGRSLREHGTDFRHPRLDARFRTAAEILSDHGYATAAFSNNPWVARDTEIVRGFDACDVIYHFRHIAQSSIQHLWERSGWRPLLPWFDEDFGGALTNSLIDEWLDQQANRDQPMFLFVNYMDAHIPYRVPAAHRARFMTDEQVARSYALRYRVYGNMVTAMDRRFNFEGGDFLAESDENVLRRQYDAGIHYADRRLGELIGMFASRGLLDHTLVVVVSDHGEYLGTHGMWTHRMQAYQDVLDVTLMLRPPGAEPRRWDLPVQPSDLFGTVLAATVGTNGVPLAQDAVDLLNLDEKAAHAERVVISEYGGPAPENLALIRERGDPEILHRAQPQIAAQERRYKYIASADGVRELYDLDADPGELNNLINRLPNVAERLASAITAWHARTPRYEPPSDADPVTLDPDVLRALRSLGYLGEE